MPGLGVQVVEAMTVVKIEEVPKGPYLPPLFTGPGVTRQPLISDSKELRQA